MLSFLLDAIDEHARGASPRRIVAITVPAPPGAAEALLGAEAAALGTLLFWGSPDGEPDAGASDAAPPARAAGSRWAFVGRGGAAQIDPAGPRCIDDLLASARELFAVTEERRHPDVEVAPPPRLYGGIAFRSEPARGAPWAPFGDASFAMPRWLYGTTGDRAFLRLTLGPGDTAPRAEVERVLAALQDPPNPPADTGAPPAEVRWIPLEAWSERLADALGRIRAGGLAKVVPAAVCHARSARPFDVGAALARLRRAYPACLCFAFQRGGATFLGASPERLVTRRGAEISTDALAGSVVRGRVPDEDAVRALLASDKDQREHRAVVVAIEEALRPLASALDVPKAPGIRSLPNVHHLWTPIRATLARPTHVLEIVRALHPTPAVCGAPREAAMRWISEHEPTPRGWYAGALGHCDAAGDGAFFVGLRSGVIVNDEAWLYAGAGVVEGSDPRQEYAEIRAKCTPVLSALGLVS